MLLWFSETSLIRLPVTYYGHIASLIKIGGRILSDLHHFRAIQSHLLLYLSIAASVRKLETTTIWRDGSADFSARSVLQPPDSDNDSDNDSDMIVTTDIVTLQL